jgi:hypothetical protein
MEKSPTLVDVLALTSLSLLLAIVTDVNGVSIQNLEREL